MIQINLLPGGAASRPSGAARSVRNMPALPKFGGDPRVSGLAAAALLFVLVAGSLFWDLGTRRGELQAQVDREVADSSRLAATIALVQELEARQDTIRQKIDVIRSVDQRRYVWPHLMQEISRALPQYTWLTKVASAEEASAPAPAAKSAGASADSAKAPSAPAVPAGPTFTIEGNTGSTQALTRFMKNLEASPMIRDVSLVTSSQATEQGRVFLKFSLEAKYDAPDSSAIQTVPLFAAQ